MQQVTSPPPLAGHSPPLLPTAAKRKQKKCHQPTGKQEGVAGLCKGQARAYAWRTHTLDSAHISLDLPGGGGAGGVRLTPRTQTGWMALGASPVPTPISAIWAGRGGGDTSPEHWFQRDKAGADGEENHWPLRILHIDSGITWPLRLAYCMKRSSRGFPQFVAPKTCPRTLSSVSAPDRDDVPQEAQHHGSWRITHWQKHLSLVSPAQATC